MHPIHLLIISIVSIDRLVWLELLEFLDLPKMQVPPNVEFVHLFKLEPTTLLSLYPDHPFPHLWFSALFGHVSFPFAVITCNILYSPSYSRLLPDGKVIHTVKIDNVKQIVDVESSGKSVDEIDKETVSFGEMQLKQEDQSCVHASIELHLHVVHVVPSEHESNQH
ncbi:hypothetical protein Tco_0905591 [Tanacetum coccineum]